MTKEIGGTAYVKIDGVQYNFRGALKVNEGGKVRTPVMGGDARLHGFTSKYKEATAEFQLSDTGTLNVAALRAIESSTITLELGNGKSHVLSGGMQVDDPDTDNMEGMISIKFAGQTLTTILGS